MVREQFTAKRFKYITLLCVGLFLSTIAKSGHTAKNYPIENIDSTRDQTIPPDTLHILRDSQQLMDSLEYSKGFSLNIQHPDAQKFLSSKDSLYMVSPYPERSQIFRGGVKLEQIMKFKEKNQDLLTQENHILGGWREIEIDSTTGKSTIIDYLDVSVGVYNKDNALDIARDKGQLAIYFPPTGETVYLIVTAKSSSNR